MRTTPSTSNHRSRPEPDARLIRGLRRGDLVALVINSVVGAGIFGLPSQVYALAGTYSLAAYGVAAVAIGLVVLCFAEVGSRFGATGGPYLYTRVAFGPLIGFQVGRVLKSGDDITLGGSQIKVIWTPGHTLGAAAYFITTQENGRSYQIVYGGPPGPITGDPKYDTRPEDGFNSYKALRAMNSDILISGHPQALLKGKLEALWANKRPSPLALGPGQWAKMIEYSEANFKERMAESNAPAR